MNTFFLFVNKVKLMIEKKYSNHQYPNTIEFMVWLCFRDLY